VTGDIWDLLISFTDFVTFKELMLAFKVCCAMHQQNGPAVIGLGCVLTPPKYKIPSCLGPLNISEEYHSCFTKSCFVFLRIARNSTFPAIFPHCFFLSCAKKSLADLVLCLMGFAFYSSTARAKSKDFFGLGFIYKKGGGFAHMRVGCFKGCNLLSIAIGGRARWVEQVPHAEFFLFCISPFR